MIKLGDIVKESVSGLVGQVHAITNWLYGCRRVTIRPQGLDKDGLPYKNWTFDEPELELIVPEKKGRAKPIGGPRSSPTRNSDPK